MVGLCVPFPARGGCFGVGRSETFQTLSLSLSLSMHQFQSVGEERQFINSSISMSEHDGKRGAFFFYLQRKIRKAGDV